MKFAAQLGLLLRGLMLRVVRSRACESISAYCPQCGGQTLLRSAANDVVFCPLCG